MENRLTNIQQNEQTDEVIKKEKLKKNHDIGTGTQGHRNTLWLQYY